MEWTSIPPKKKGLYWIRNNRNHCIWPLELRYNDYKKCLEWFEIGFEEAIDYNALDAEEIQYMEAKCPDTRYPYFWSVRTSSFIRSLDDLDEPIRIQEESNK